MASRAPRILVVDDSPITREILCAIIEAEGWEPIEAASGREAIAAAGSHSPDLVLLDVMMPDGSGYDVCEELRRRDPEHELPIIFLSSSGDSANRIEGLNRGGDDFVAKPFDPAEIVARVRSRLAVRNRGRVLSAAHQTLLDRQARLDEDIRAAAGIQQALLPDKPPPVPGLDVAWRFLPCDQVGGDLFQVVQLDERHVALYMIDVTGHGIPAGMLTAALAKTLSPEGNIVRQPDGSVRPPAEVLRLLDREYPIERFERCFSIAYLLLDVTTGLLRYSRAGHPMPVCVRGDGVAQLLPEGGTLIGLGDMLPIEEGAIQLRAGDRLFVYTDGVAEAEGQQGELYGDDRVQALLSSSRALPLDGTCDALFSAIRSFSGGRDLRDDAAVVALELGIAA